MICLADSFFWHENCTEHPALNGIEVSRIHTKNLDRAESRLAHFTRKSARQLDLSVTGDTGNPEDLPATNLEADVIQVNAVRLIRTDLKGMHGKTYHSALICYPLGNRFDPFADHFLGK